MGSWGGDGWWSRVWGVRWKCWFCGGWYVGLWRWVVYGVSCLSNRLSNSVGRVSGSWGLVKNGVARLGFRIVKKQVIWRRLRYECWDFSRCRDGYLGLYVEMVFCQIKL